MRSELVGIDGEHHDGALLRDLRAPDRVSIKPHAAPVLHAITPCWGGSTGATSPELEQQLAQLQDVAGSAFLNVSAIGLVPATDERSQARPPTNSPTQLIFH